MKELATIKNLNKNGGLVLIYLLTKNKWDVRCVRKALKVLEAELDKKNVGFRDLEFERLVSINMDLINQELIEVFVVENTQMDEVLKRFEKLVTRASAKENLSFIKIKKDILIPRKNNVEKKVIAA